MKGITAFALSRGYTNSTAEEFGAVKGASCQIQSITSITGGKRITFLWKNSEDVTQTSTLDVMDGEDGSQGEQGEQGIPGLGIKSTKIQTIEGKKHLIVIYDDDTEEDAGILPEGGSASALTDLTDVEIEEPTDGQVLAYDEETGKFKNVDNQGGGDASLESAVTSNLAVGAIASGTTLEEGTTFTEFVQKLLVSEIAPTVNFSITKSGNVVYGGSYTETLTVNVSAMGTAKSITKVEWYEGNTKLGETTESPYTYTMGSATTDSTTFKAVVTYVKSDDTSASITKTSSINFYYNKFYGAVSELAPSEATVEALTTALGTGKGGTYSFTTSASRICYAYPKSLGALTSIKDGNGFSLFDSFTRTEQTYTQNGTSVAYYRYVLTDPTTVSSYNVIFA